MPYPEVLPDIIVLTLVGAFELWLGIYFLVKYQRTASVKIFGLLILAIGTWVFTNGASLIFSNTSDLGNYISRTTFVAALYIFPLLQMYVKSFPITTYRFTNEYIFAAFLPAVILMLFIYFSDSLVIGFSEDKYGTVIFGPAFWIFATYIFVMYIVSLIQMFAKQKELTGQHKSILNLLFTGTAVSGFIGVFVILIWAYLFQDQKFNTIGPASSIIWAVLVGKKILENK